MSGADALPEIGPETDDEGHYRIGGVSAGSFQVAVHDRDGHRVGIGSVDVNSGVTATFDFAISADATPTPGASATLVEEPTEVFESGADLLIEDGFRALLTAQDVEAVLASKVLLVTELYDYRQRAESVDLAQFVNIESFYGLSFQAEDGTAGVTFSVMDFDTEASAQAQADAQGIGSVFVFVVGDKLVSLHTSMPEGETPLVSLEGRQQLTRTVERRLP